MLNLEFRDDEMTASEQFSMENCVERLKVLDMLSFVLARVANVTDEGEKRALAEQLLARPASELRRHFNEAMTKALPATVAAARAVDDEFRQRAEPDDGMFPAYMKLPGET